jgi:N,N'-diacetyllegionaminate synthase
LKTLIIAEAGVNHNGELGMAKELIEIAADAGADLVKFQTFSADRLATKYSKKALYQQSGTKSDESQHAMLKRLELTLENHLELMSHCEMIGIGFFSTGFDIQSIELLTTLGQDRFKIPSGEITNYPYLRHIGKLSKNVILSTGMTTMKEIGDALDILQNYGTERAKITVLHCTTAYPAPMDEVNLRAMQTIHESFNVAVGYSDHTLGIEIPIAAVALGATVIEKHFTVNKSLAGPDHKASLDPDELKAMVDGIRNIEVALGDGVKRLMPSEAGNKNVIRKSIVAKHFIKKDETLTISNITTKRPGNGISSAEWDNVIGKKAVMDFQADDLIEL